MKSMKRSVIMIGVVALAAALTVGGTIMYFSDTETSAGNVFKAGKLNLAVASECSYNGKECICDGPACQWAGTDEPCTCAWEEKDLAGELFFNLDDVKPGDFGEATIGLRVRDNDAWVCAQVAKIENYDNGCEAPELAAETAKYGAGNETCGDPGEGEGELGDHLLLTMWQDDDCDNVLDEGESVYFENQPIAAVIQPLADATTGNGPFLGDGKYCVGAA